MIIGNINKYLVSVSIQPYMRMDLLISIDMFICIKKSKVKIIINFIHY